MQHVEAKIGSWYEDPKGHVFEVVALEEDGSIEIQHFEGEIEELENETWAELFLAEVRAPEDWTGAYDKLDPGDLSYADAASANLGLDAALAVLETQD